MLRVFTLFAFVYVNMTFAHPADPTGDIVKYLMYGQDGIEYKFKFVSPNTVGYIGSASSVDFGNWPGGTNVSAPVYTRGILDVSCDTDFYGNIFVVGNLGNDPDGCGVGSTRMYQDVNATGNITGTWPVDGTTNANDASVNSSVPDVDISSFNYSVNTSGSNVTISSAQTLAPGTYGNLTLNAVVTFQEGVYEFNSIKFNSGGGIYVNKTPGTATRILVKNNLDIGWNDYGIRTNVSSGDSYGKVLVYLENETAVVTPSGAANFALDATILAPKTKLTIGSDARLRGQLLAKEIVVNNDLNLDAASYQPFDPSGVSLAGAATISFSEDNDSEASTINSRIIEIPIELSSATNEDAELDFEIRTLSSGAWSLGKNAAIVGTDTSSSDIASVAALSTADLTGTLYFLTDSTHPTVRLQLYLVDDLIPETTTGESEYFEIKLFNPTSLKLENDANAVYADDDSLIYIVPIISDDAGNQAPNDITIASTTLNERSIHSIDLTTVDSDNAESEITYTIIGGADSSYFSINGTNGNLELDDPAVFENSSGTVQDTSLEVQIRATDDGGEYTEKTFTLSVKNRNDEKPNTYPDALTLDEGASAKVDVSANDNDLIDGMTLSGTYSLVGANGGAQFASSVSFDGDSLVYTHDDSENFTDTVWYELNDGGIIASRSTDTNFVVITINSLNDNLPIISDQTISRAESTPVSTELVTFTASDLDIATGFAFFVDSGNGSSLVSIDATSGVVTLTSGLDYETANQHILKVGVVSQVDTAFAYLTLNVTNTNEAPVLSSNGTLSIDENTLADTEVTGNVSIDDVDDSDFTWTLLDSTIFKIDASTGVISLVQDSSLNYEVLTSVEVTIIVDDGEFQDSLTIDVEVNDVNDAAMTRDTTILVEENTTGSIGLIKSQDEDATSSLRYNMVDSDMFIVDSLTGELSLIPDSILDYEKETSYRVLVEVVDGLFLDTVEVTLALENIIETPTLDVVKVIDDEGQEWTNTDSIYTSSDSLTVIWEKDGVLDTLRYELSEGVNTISEDLSAPAKDASVTESFEVKVNRQAPIIKIVDNEVPQDSNGVFYVNDLDKDSILVEVTYVDKDLKTQNKLINVSLEEFVKEGKIKVENGSFSDDFNNESSYEISVLLDTEDPEVSIISPVHLSDHDSLQIIVDWVVRDNGEVSSFKDTAIVTDTKYYIIKTAVDFAGNTHSDTVIIIVDMEDSDSQVKVVRDLVKEQTEESILEYFDEKQRYDDPAFDDINLDTDNDGIPDIERANVSVVNKANQTLTEVQVNTVNGVIKRTVFTESPLNTDLATGGVNLRQSSTGLALRIDVSFPMNGGYTQNGSGERRGGFIPDSLIAKCGGDTTMYDLKVNDINIHVFDQLGQYVTKVVIPGVEIVNTEWQGDDGVVSLLLDIPQLRNGLKSASGVNLGSGVYIMNGVVRAKATPKECVADLVAPRSSSTTLLEQVGYQRRDIN